VQACQHSALLDFDFVADEKGEGAPVSDLSARLLAEIRDGVNALATRLDVTNFRLEGLEKRVGETNDRLGHLETEVTGRLDRLERSVVQLGETVEAQTRAFKSLDQSLTERMVRQETEVRHDVADLKTRVTALEKRRSTRR